jgi:hypothetical protein
VKSLRKRIKDLTTRAINLLPLPPQVVARLESISILESKVRDLQMLVSGHADTQILCAQL